LKPYFPLDKTVEGLFETARRLYGITFEPAPDIEVYHPDVKAYKVIDADGTFLAVFYADFFPRPGKRQGAWMTSFKPQYKRNGINSRPHISIVMNFSKPTGDEPSLLSFYEVNTLYHEFGHALHGMLSQVTYPGLSGTNVYWDFVELPSQMMENWTYEPEVLKMFAKHYKTGEPIPFEYIEKLKEEKKFLEGLATLRQLGFGYLDMAWHHRFPGGYGNIVDYENEAVNPTRFYEYVPGTLISTSFGHLFAGGYAAGYYSYKWAELLDADAFSVFKKKRYL
jgi:peptidyl-dipeptidase Dcp